VPRRRVFAACGLGVAGVREGGPAEPNQMGDGNRHHPRVFVSYAWDNGAHVDRVDRFCDFLRDNGIDARYDLPTAEQRTDWAAWAEREVREAEWVLVVASPEYKRCTDGRAGATERRGVQWETRHIMSRFYADQDRGLREILPVVLPGCSAADIPGWLAPISTTRYTVRGYTVGGAEELIRVLTGQPGEVARRLGNIPELPPRDALDAPSPLPMPPGAAVPAPLAASDTGKPEGNGNETLLRALADVCSALSAIRPSPSWTAREWILESTSLGMRLDALTVEFRGLSGRRKSRARAVREVGRLNTRLTEAKRLAEDIRTSLDHLKGDGLPPEARDRELSVFVASSTGLRRAALHVQSMIYAADSSEGTREDSAVARLDPKNRRLSAKCRIMRTMRLFSSGVEEWERGRRIIPRR
jgi:SEFIR domain